MWPNRLDLLWYTLATGALALGSVVWWRTPPIATGIGSQAPMVALWLSAAILASTAWLRTTRPDGYAAPLLGSLALAASVPLSAVPLEGVSTAAVVTALVTAGLAPLPLAIHITRRLASTRTRSGALVLVLLATMGAAAVGLSLASGDGQVGRAVWWLLVSTSVVVPAVMVAAQTIRGVHLRPTTLPQPRIRGLTILVIGAIPALACLSLATPAWPVMLVPAVAATVTAALMARYLVQPLAGLVSSATGERDRLVAAAEAERTRLASVLHDGPLAEVTLLVQRFDERHDPEGAAIARSIAHELRAIGSELRLPLLDDLGTGPALEWLVDRLATRSGSNVRIEQTTLARPPGPVELAIYRVAQEALVNALKHGSAPIVVRYRATAQRVALSVDDAGPGITGDAYERAEREGRLGLHSMVQRADAIGARLVLMTSPGGGTHVGLEWSPGTA